MATWIAHLRIAEKLLEKYEISDRRSFAFTRQIQHISG